MNVKELTKVADTIEVVRYTGANLDEIRSYSSNHNFVEQVLLCPPHNEFIMSDDKKDQLVEMKALVFIDHKGILSIIRQGDYIQMTGKNADKIKILTAEKVANSYIEVK